MSFSADSVVIYSVSLKLVNIKHIHLFKTYKKYQGSEFILKGDIKKEL